MVGDTNSYCHCCKAYFHPECHLFYILFGMKMKKWRGLELLAEPCTTCNTVDGSDQKEKPTVPAKPDPVAAKTGPEEKDDQAPQAEEPSNKRPKKTTIDL